MADLRKQARAHLERWPTTTAGLRAALIRRLCQEGECEADELSVAQVADVDAALAALQRSGELDDEAWAADRVARLRARGSSEAKIRADLRGRGIDDAVADALLTAEEDHEWLAACRLARRRGLGPFRPADAREARLARDLGVLARGGFGEDLSRRLLEDTGREEILELLERHA